MKQKRKKYIIYQYLEIEGRLQLNFRLKYWFVWEVISNSRYVFFLRFQNSSKFVKKSRLRLVLKLASLYLEIGGRTPTRVWNITSHIPFVRQWSSTNRFAWHSRVDSLHSGHVLKRVSLPLQCAFSWMYWTLRGLELRLTGTSNEAREKPRVLQATWEFSRLQLSPHTTDHVFFRNISR